MNGISASNSPDIRVLDNVIAASAAGISISGPTAIGWTIARNRIGTSAVGVPTAAFANEVGIRISNGSGQHLIGSTGSNATSNVIAGSEQAGVWLTETAGANVTVRGNQIFNNGQGGSGLGIDLGALGPLANDSGDVDAGPNNGQNSPVILTSQVDGNTRQVSGTINGSAGDSYRIDLFRAPDCAGGARGGNLFAHVGLVLSCRSAASACTDGATPFALQIANGTPGWLTAIATHLDNGDTSEVSACFQEDTALFMDGFDA